MNPDVGQECPFCSQRESIFHTFVLCDRLKDLFSFLKHFLNRFNEEFSIKLFIFGFKYIRTQQRECQLINFILGKAKMSIYMSRKDKIEKNFDVNVFSVSVSRLRIDFLYYKSIDCLLVFEDIWCQREALCSVIENKLYFSNFY